MEVEFVGLFGPPTLTVKQFAELQDVPSVRPAYDRKRKKELHILLTSAGGWECEHSSFYKYMNQSRASAEELTEAGVTGDLIWRPLSSDGVIRESAKDTLRAMTLYDLEELPGFIDGGGRVILALGPCGVCDTRKAAVFRAIMEQKKLVTDVVADMLTTRDILPEEDPFPAREPAVSVPKPARSRKTKAGKVKKTGKVKKGGKGGK